MWSVMCKTWCGVWCVKHDVEKSAPFESFVCVCIVYIYVFARMCACVCARARTCAWACGCVHVGACVYVRVCMYCTVTATMGANMWPIWLAWHSCAGSRYIKRDIDNPKKTYITHQKRPIPAQKRPIPWRRICDQFDWPDIAALGPGT